MTTRITKFVEFIRNIYIIKSIIVKLPNSLIVSLFNLLAQVFDLPLYYYRNEILYKKNMEEDYKKPSSILKIKYVNAYFLSQETFE